MKEPHSEGVANHADLESCAGGGDAAGEALTEALAGRPLSREILNSGRRPCGQKGKATSIVATSRAATEPGAVGRTRARQETLRARTGRPPPRSAASRPVGEGQGRTAHVYGAEESERATSTREGFEQRREIVGGGSGGKGLHQGERSFRRAPSAHRGGQR